MTGASELAQAGTDGNNVVVVSIVFLLVMERVFKFIKEWKNPTNGTDAASQKVIKDLNEHMTIRRRIEEEKHSKIIETQTQMLSTLNNISINLIKTFDVAKETRDWHAADSAGVQEWKNPGLRPLIVEMLEATRATIKREEATANLSIRMSEEVKATRGVLIKQTAILEKQTIVLESVKNAMDSNTSKVMHAVLVEKDK